METTPIIRAPRTAPADHDRRLRVACIVGSLAPDSINRKLAERLRALAPTGMSLGLVPIDGLPVYHWGLDDTPDPARIQFKQHIASSDLLLFVTPEYNRSIPAALKNALDHGSRPWGDNTWAGKKAAVIGTGLNSAGSAVAQSHLRGILGYLRVAVLPAPEVCLTWRPDLLDDPHVTSLLRGFLDQVLGLA